MVNHKRTNPDSQACSKRRAMPKNIYLPKEIMAEICSHLPIKSVLRFMCCSKSFYSELSGLKLKHASQKLLLSMPSGLQSLDYESSFGDQSSIVDLNFAFKMPGGRVRIVGSSNGLVCLASRYFKEYYICNPSTGFYRKITDCPDEDLMRVQLGLGGRCKCFRYGFAYDSGDYKIVLLYPRLGSPGNDCTVSVFSLKSNSWKTLADYKNDFPTHLRADDRGFLSNGALHWKLGTDTGFIIIAFELREEKFSEVPRVNQQEKLLLAYEGFVSPFCITKSGAYISLKHERLMLSNSQGEIDVVHEHVLDAIPYMQTLISPNYYPWNGN